MKNNWQTKELGEIAKIKGGKRIPKGYKLKYEKTDHPYIRVADFNDYGSVDLNNILYIDTNVFEQIKNYTISSNDLYVSIAGTIGKTGIIPKKLDGANLTENACKLIFKESINLKYVYYFTKTADFTNQAGLNTRTAAMPKLALERLSTIRLWIPDSITEQKRIVKNLDEVFEKIEEAKENTEKNLQNSHRLFESYLNNVFKNPIDGWETKRLNEICNIKHGYAFKSALFKSDYHSNNPIILTPGNFKEDGGVIFTKKNTKRCFGTYPIDFKLRIGDLVIVMTDLSSKMKILGKPAIIEKDNILHNQRIGKVVYKNSTLDKKYLFFYFLSNQFTESIKLTATGTMVKHTAPGRILQNIISYPKSLIEQRNIIKELDDLSEKTKQLEEIYRQKLANLEELKKSVLQKAFAGEL